MGTNLFILNNYLGIEIVRGEGEGVLYFGSKVIGPRIPFEVNEMLHHLQLFSVSGVFREKVPSFNIMIGSTRPDYE